MTSESTVKQSSATLAAAVQAEDWARADRELQYFAGAWQRARLRGMSSAKVASAVNELRMQVVTDHDVDQEPGPEQFAWMLAGVCSFLNQAVTPVELTGHDVESRILEALATGGDAVSTSDLAELIGRSNAATARALPELRTRGLTSEARAGRMTLNAITAAGREHVAQVKAEEQRKKARHDATPISIVRRREVEPQPIDAREIASVVETNELSALLKFGR